MLTNRESLASRFSLSRFETLLVTKSAKNRLGFVWLCSCTLLVLEVFQWLPHPCPGKTPGTTSLCLASQISDSRGGERKSERNNFFSRHYLCQIFALCRVFMLSLCHSYPCHHHVIELLRAAGQSRDKQHPGCLCSSPPFSPADPDGRIWMELRSEPI